MRQILTVFSKLTEVRGKTSVQTFKEKNILLQCTIFLKKLERGCFSTGKRGRKLPEKGKEVKRKREMQTGWQLSSWGSRMSFCPSIPARSLWYQFIFTVKSSLWYQILWNCSTFLFSLLVLIIYQTLWGNSQAPSVAAGMSEAWVYHPPHIRRATLVSSSSLTFNFSLLIGNCELLWVLF